MRYWWINDLVPNRQSLYGIVHIDGLTDYRHIGVMDMLPGDRVVFWTDSPKVLSGFGIVTDEPIADSTQADVPVTIWPAGDKISVDEIPYTLRERLITSRPRHAPLNINAHPKQGYCSPIPDDVSEQLWFDLIERSRTFIEDDDNLSDPSQPSAPLAAIPRTGETDKVREVTTRLEQNALRGRLTGNRDFNTCAICHRLLPSDLIVAAHISRRADLPNNIRYDFPNVAMLLCRCGCDALFELGYIQVDDNGVITAGPRQMLNLELDLNDAVNGQLGNVVVGFSEKMRDRFKERRDFIAKRYRLG